MNILYALVYTHRRATYQILNTSCIPNKKIKSISNYRAKIRHCHNRWNGKFTGVLIRPFLPFGMEYREAVCAKTRFIHFLIGIQ